LFVIGGWLPLVFAVVMALSMLAYVVLGRLRPRGGYFAWNKPMTFRRRDTMIASIGPFCGCQRNLARSGSWHSARRISGSAWGNSGKSLSAGGAHVARPELRGIAFDFRVKAQPNHRPMWNRVFAVRFGL
jgi:cytochrome d ubiquinol oxidase subunit II